VEFRHGSGRRLPDGSVRYGVVELMLPCIRVVPNPIYSPPDTMVEALGFMMPIDDTHFRIYTAGRTRQKGRVFEIPEQMFKMFGGGNMPNWFAMSEEERRAKPGDWEAQTGQGPITLHSEEHLSGTDRGVLLVRKMLSDQLKRIKRGEDPKGLVFDADAPPVRTTAGSWTEPPPLI
jgi:hypothetical protein